MRLLLIRHPGRTGQVGGSRRLYLCDSRPGGSGVRASTVGDPAELLGLDLRAGAAIPGARAVAAPLVLVCTHGRRDRCCAVRGRAIAARLDALVGARLAALDPDAAVWECSHTGGHRFAPAMVLLEAGYTYGSGDSDSYERAVEGVLEGRVGLDGLCGRSTWPAAGQVAEIAVRASGVDVGVDALHVDRDADRGVDRGVDGDAGDAESNAAGVRPRQ